MDFTIQMDSKTQIDNCECCLCDHKLDHYALKVCTHPTIPVPLCLLCSEELSSRLQDNEEDAETEDQCSFCGMCEQGELFICGDGTTCTHSFCSECLKRNLGNDFLTSLQNSDDDWTCLVCNPKQISKLSEIGRASCRERVSSPV